jgi:hypothetical protein
VIYVFSGIGNSEALHIAVERWGVVGMTRDFGDHRKYSDADYETIHADIQTLQKLNQGGVAVITTEKDFCRCSTRLREEMVAYSQNGAAGAVPGVSRGASIVDTFVVLGELEVICADERSELETVLRRTLTRADIVQE